VDDAGQLMFHKSEGHKVLSVSRLQLRRREACIRQQACQLYQSQKLEDVFLRLEIEVESRRLTVRLDRTIHSDIGLRERLIEVLNSYTAVWQRLGVEVYRYFFVMHKFMLYNCVVGQRNVALEEKEFIVLLKFYPNHCSINRCCLVRFFLHTPLMVDSWWMTMLITV